jgi:hypothetical protein
MFRIPITTMVLIKTNPIDKAVLFIKKPTGKLDRNDVTSTVK